MEQQQEQQCAQARRRNCRENRNRMNVALVKHTEHDIHGNQRRENQHWLAGERILESGSRTLETCLN